MATDVVPELNAKIEASFKGFVMRDRSLKQISNRIRDGTADFVDAHAYAERLGENLSRALVTNLTQEKLPNGILYYNIAERTVIPGLENNYTLINEAAELVQKSQDQKLKIGLGAIRADFPQERIQGLIDKITQELQPVDMVVRWLQEPIINNSEAFADDFIRVNAKLRNDLGLKSVITRIADPKCCDWCAALAGRYEYGKEPREIYARHEYCRCVVTYQSERTSQNAWSKKTWQSSPEELARRKDAGTQMQLSAREKIEQANQIYRDQNIQKYMEETGTSNRRYAAAKTLRKNPEQIEAAIKKIRGETGQGR